jgi:hypothetical protein
VEHCEIKEVSYALVWIAQLKNPSLASHRRKATEQLADARAIEMAYVAEI